MKGKILIINPGSTSTKIGFYEDGQQKFEKNLNHSAEEIAKYTDRMDHQTAVLDHYSSLLEIMGKSNDYKTMGKVLEGKAKTLGDQASVAKKTMEMYKD
jgi:butyrate kinase